MVTVFFFSFLFLLLVAVQGSGMCVYVCFGLLSGGVDTTGRECRIAKKDKAIGFKERDRVKNED